MFMNRKTLEPTVWNFILSFSQPSLSFRFRISTTCFESDISVGQKFRSRVGLLEEVKLELKKSN